MPDDKELAKILDKLKADGATEDELNAAIDEYDKTNQLAEFQPAKEMGAPRTPEQLATQRANLAKYQGPDTYDEGVAAGRSRFANQVLGITPGIGPELEAGLRGAGGYLRGAITDIPASLMGAIGTGINLITDPVGTVEGIPEAWQGMKDLAYNADTQPEEFGRMLGNIFGQGAVTGKFAPKLLRAGGNKLRGARVAESMPKNIYAGMPGHGPRIGMDTKGLGGAIGRFVNNRGQNMVNIGNAIDAAGNYDLANLFRTKPPAPTGPVPINPAPGPVNTGTGAVPISNPVHNPQAAPQQWTSRTGTGFGNMNTVPIRQGTVISPTVAQADITGGLAPNYPPSPMGFSQSIDAAYQGTPLQLPAPQAGLPPGGLKVDPNAARLLTEAQGRPAIPMPGEVAPPPPIDLGMQSPSVARGTHITHQVPPANRALPQGSREAIQLGPGPSERVTINQPSSATTKKLKKQGYVLESSKRGYQVWIKP